MGLDKNINDRNYLYGRLYAIAEYFDVTNKGYYMSNFRTFPFRYWKHFYKRLLPKLHKLNAPKREYFENLLVEILSKFTGENFFIKNEIGEQSLNGLYIMGFHNQRMEINERWCKNND